MDAHLAGKFKRLYLRDLLDAAGEPELSDVESSRERRSNHQTRVQPVAHIEQQRRIFFFSRRGYAIFKLPIKTTSEAGGSWQQQRSPALDPADGCQQVLGDHARTLGSSNRRAAQEPRRCRRTRRKLGPRLRREHRNKE